MQMPCIIQIKQTAANTDIKYRENIPHILNKAAGGQDSYLIEDHTAAFKPSAANSLHIANRYTVYLLWLIKFADMKWMYLKGANVQRWLFCRENRSIGVGIIISGIVR